MNAGERDFLLRTLGHPVLTGPGGGPVGGLRRKDLALLAYLCVEGQRPHSRARLAALLWGESPESKARHSLTQALGRILRAAGTGTLVVERDLVRSTGEVWCDAQWLLAGDERLDPLLTLYDGPFLEGFEAGFGSEEFGEWADGQRAELRNAALRWLERAGAEAEAAEDWPLALQVGERGTQIDPVHEQAHRRVMRALLELGERNRALRHYQEFADWLREEVGSEPDPDTTELAERIRAATAPAPPPPAPRPPTDRPAAEPPAPEVPAPERPEPVDETPTADDSGSPEPPPVPAASSAADPDAVRPPGVGWWLVAAALAVLLLRAAFSAVWDVSRPRPSSLPAHGESIQARAGGPVYLAYGETLWRYPDTATLDRCLGNWRQRIRRVRALPPWRRRTLLSVRTHPWQGGTGAVVTDRSRHPTQHVAVGCVLAPIPDSLTFLEIFGHKDWSRSFVEADSLLRASPRTRLADPYPVRQAGTLIQGAGAGVKWVVYHGGALLVAPRLLAGYCRSLHEVVSVTDAEFVYYHAYGSLSPAEPACRKPEHHP